MTIQRGVLLVILIVLAACGSVPQPVRVAPSPDAPVTVFVYFTDSSQNLPAAPHPVPRQILAAPTSEDQLRATLEMLLQGPTEAERQAGLDSWFSDATAGMIQQVTLGEDGAAIISFHDVSRIIPNTSTSAGSSMLLSQLHATVFQFPAVRTVTYQFNGSCDVFWNWLQAACQPVSRDDWLMTQ